MWWNLGVFSYSKSLFFRDTNWNIYRWNHTIPRNCFKVIQEDTWGKGKMRLIGCVLLIKVGGDHMSVHYYSTCICIIFDNKNISFITYIIFRIFSSTFIMLLKINSIPGIETGPISLTKLEFSPESLNVIKFLFT